MLRRIRENSVVLAVAAAALTVGLVAPAVGHGVQHALFAHNADKLDNKDSKAFLGSNLVVTSHGGAGWLEHFAGPSTVDRYVSGVIVTGTGGMVMPLDAASGFGGVKYGLKSVTLCFYTTGDSKITSVSVYRTQASSAVRLLLDDTERTTSSDQLVCDEIVVDKPVARGASLLVQVSGTSGEVRLEAVQAKWTKAAAKAKVVPRQVNSRANG